jgi:hypothetical protein
VTDTELQFLRDEILKVVIAAVKAEALAETDARIHAATEQIFRAIAVQAASVLGALGVAVPASSADPEASPKGKDCRRRGNGGVWVLPTVRIAWVMMFKTKGELEIISRELERDAFEVMGSETRERLSRTF